MPSRVVARPPTATDVSRFGAISSQAARARSIMRITGALLITLLLSATAFGHEPVTIYLAGDSTMAHKLPEKRPETGWGEALPQFFDGRKVVIENHAQNG